MKDRLYIELKPTECYGNFACPNGAEILGEVSHERPAAVENHRVAIFTLEADGSWKFLEIEGPFE